MLNVLKRVYAEHGIGSFGYYVINFLLFVVTIAYGVSLYKGFEMFHLYTTVGGVISAALIGALILSKCDKYGNAFVGKALVYYFASVRLVIFTALMLSVKGIFYVFGI